MWKWLNTPKSPETQEVSGDKLNLDETKTPVWNILSLRVNDNAIKNLLVLWKLENALIQIKNNYEIIDWNIFIPYLKNDRTDNSSISTIWNFKNIKNLRPDSEIDLKTLIYFMKAILKFEDKKIADLFLKHKYFWNDNTNKSIFKLDFEILIHSTEKNWFKLQKKPTI